MRLGSTFAGAAGIAALALLAGCESQTAQFIVPSTTTTAVSAEAGETLVVHVPEMNCPHFCWPEVEKTLAAQPGVLDVELAPQKDADVIDNPKVFVRVSEEFDADAAVAKLAAAGFDNSDVEAAN